MRLWWKMYTLKFVPPAQNLWHQNVVEGIAIIVCTFYHCTNKELDNIFDLFFAFSQLYVVKDHYGQIIISVWFSGF